MREASPDCCIYANYGGWKNKAHGIETKGPFAFDTPMKTDGSYQPAAVWQLMRDNTRIWR